MNPFTLKYNPQFFCDRETELNYLKDNSINGLNTLVHSPRRLGKSALIHHLFHKLESKNEFETIFIDIFATRDLKEFTKLFGEAILKKYHTKNILEGIKRLFKGIQTSISITEDGTPQLSLGINDGQVNSSIEQLFNYLEKRKKPVIVAFDEFQEVSNYPEKAEAVLRTYIQRLKNVTFIYSGSSNHILEKMFYSTKQPFYQSCESLVIGKINKAKYATFIKSGFKNRNKTVTDEAIEHLLHFTETHTYYTQVICNQSFYYSEKTFTLEDALKQTSNYIEIRKIDYYSIYSLLPSNQKSLIIAIAKEGCIDKATAISFIIKYKLPSASSTLQALKSLEEKQMIFHTLDGYKVYDVFFRRFLERYY